jgi:hAT family C-terminal dimerisation region
VEKRGQRIPHIISKIARDVLVVPISTVAAQSASSLSSRVINPHRIS